ncbi:hypothetical protein LI90_1622 [Carbonactinospora thermoautotrophica]|uniref:Uncharacterized protein n=1 Tax=Carbonactinospora thermoautotrophica TaxID=1469144 RepID=A0A132MQ70_9ACTN|nr:hypothetical protein LI90_1622 [Carbonactinospora thermoautotrophica]
MGESGPGGGRQLLVILAVMLMVIAGLVALGIWGAHQG